LWSSEMDGIEGNEELTNHFGMVNLHPDQWFLPFRSEEDD
jgi:hypothetical protein